MRGRRGALVVAVTVALAAGAAGVALALGASSDESRDEARDPAGTPPTSPAPSSPQDLGHGLRLVPGEDGGLPVEVRWVVQATAPEGLRVVDDEVLVADDCFLSLDVETGATNYEACKPDGEAIYSDGHNRIGSAGPHRVRVIAPFNDEVVIDTRSGTVVEVVPPQRWGQGRFEPYPRRPVTEFQVVDKVQVVEAVRDGRVAWSLEVADPWAAGVAAEQLPDGLVLSTASGAVVALDLVEPQPS